jgi:sortase (surface protein transpeptidase)
VTRCQSRQRQRAAITLATGLLAVLLAGCSGDGGAASSDATSRSTPAQAGSGAADVARQPRSRASTDSFRLPDDVTGPILQESVPRTVAIPSIGVASQLVPLGLSRDGTMEVPSSAADAGWYTRGPTPGALGPAVIAGHVAWNGEAGVFSGLVDLRRGDHVEVARDDGTTAVFSVRTVRRFPKADFPTRSVFGVVDHSALRLITCGGLYDNSTNRYLDNVVAFAELIAVRR